jgi:hypothetical protein
MLTYMAGLIFMKLSNTLYEETNTRADRTAITGASQGWERVGRMTIVCDQHLVL